jgi:sugar/nucleoside kinase (ribokinase family)
VLCAVGDLVEDVVVWLAGPPGVGTDVDARVFRRRGGSAANVAALCAANGTPSRFVGQVGSDALGDRMIDDLRAAGVDVRVERGGDGSRTGTVVVLVAPDGERTMLTDRGAALDLDVVDDHWLDDVDVLHLPSYSLTMGRLAVTAVELARLARRRRTMLSVDASSIATLVEFGCGRFLALLADLGPDVLLMNAAEAALLDTAGRAPKGVALAVVHRGGDSTIAIDGGGRVTEIAPVPVAAAADTTGAGDAFAAGFLPSLRRHDSIDRAIVAGHECAARTLAAPGASTEA